MTHLIERSSEEFLSSFGHSMKAFFSSGDVTKEADERILVKST